MNSELVQYFVVNKELDMSPGKIGAQVAHAATAVTLMHQQEEDFQEWLNQSQTKIILKASEKELKKLQQAGFFAVVDEGRTEIAPNSVTVVGLPPMAKEIAKTHVKRYQAL